MVGKMTSPATCGYASSTLVLTAGCSAPIISKLLRPSFRPIREVAVNRAFLHRADDRCAMDKSSALVPTAVLRLHGVTLTVLSSAFLWCVVANPAISTFAGICRHPSAVAAVPRPGSLLMNALIWTGVRPILRQTLTQPTVADPAFATAPVLPVIPFAVHAQIAAIGLPRSIPKGFC